MSGGICTIEHFGPYLYGRHFTVVTDHHSLCYLINLKDPNGRLARWALRLQPFDFEIVHKSGKKHNDADALSRNPVDPPEQKDDPWLFEEKLCQLQYKKIFHLCQLQDTDIQTLQRNYKRLEPIITALLKRTENTSQNCNTINDTYADYYLRNKILYKCNSNETGRLWLLCVPSKMRKIVLREVDVDTLNHMGLFKTYYLLKSQYFWHRMHTHTRRYIQSCITCQSKKFQCTRSFTTCRSSRSAFLPNWYRLSRPIPVNSPL